MIFQLFFNHRIILLFVYCKIKCTPLGQAQSKAEVPLPYVWEPPPSVCGSCQILLL